MDTWNVRSMNQGKWKVTKQEMARVNIDILGISKIKWNGIDEFNAEQHYIYYYGQESLIRSTVVIIVNKSPKCTGEEWKNSSRKKGRLGQSRNDAQLWMYLVVKVKSNDVKNNFT